MNGVNKKFESLDGEVLMIVIHEVVGWLVLNHGRHKDLP